MYSKNILFFDVYQKNFEEVREDYKLISNKELEILKYYNENINHMDDNTYLYVASIIGRTKWMYVITKNPYIYVDSIYGEKPTSIQQFLDSEKKYCIMFKNDCEQILIEARENNNVKILFQNEDGAVVEKIN